MYTVELFVYRLLDLLKSPSNLYWNFLICFREVFVAVLVRKATLETHFMVAMATTFASAVYMTVLMTRHVSMLDLAYTAARYMSCVL